MTLSGFFASLRNPTYDYVRVTEILTCSAPPPYVPPFNRRGEGDSALFCSTLPTRRDSSAVKRGRMTAQNLDSRH